jgi:Lar family restriction alleviation protein
MTYDRNQLTIELLPCPFCGGAAQKKGFIMGPFDCMEIRCSVCGASPYSNSSYHSADDAALKWNKRQLPRPITKG